MLRNLILTLGIVGLLSASANSNEINPVYEDPSDWRLQSDYRDYWIESQECLRENDYECSVRNLESLLSFELTARQKIELGRAIAAVYGQMSELAKSKSNWQDEVLYAERSIEFDDQFDRIKWSRHNVVAGHLTLGSWQECVEAVEFIGDPRSIENEVYVISAMHAARCLYNVNRIKEASHWIQYAQRATIKEDRIEDLSWWAQDIRLVQSALKELEPDSAPLLRPFWWEKPEYRPHVLRAIRCERERDHDCVITNLERLDDSNLSERQRAHLRRTLARHYSSRASQSEFIDSPEASFSDMKKAIELHDDPRLRVRDRGVLIYMLSHKKDWEGCIREGTALFDDERLVVTERLHMHAMRLSECYWSIGDEASARDWVDRAKLHARDQGTFIHTRWDWLLNELSTD